MPPNLRPSSVTVIEDWLAALRTHREARSISQKELAARSGLSLSAIKSYESRRRHPSRAALLCLIDAVGIPREDANRVLADAGYSVELSEILSGRLAPLSDGDIQDELASTHWPAFVTNQAFDVLFANRAIERTLGVELDQLQGPGERNLLSRMTDKSFAPKLRNWDEVLAFMMGLVKSDPRRNQSLENPTPWLDAHMQRLLRGDPAMVQRVAQLWSLAEPIEHRLRHRYRIVWEAEAGAVLEFTATFMPVDVWAELHWNEWIPADTSTWRWLELHARR